MNLGVQNIIIFLFILNHIIIIKFRKFVYVNIGPLLFNFITILGHFINIIFLDWL